MFYKTLHLGEFRHIVIKTLSYPLSGQGARSWVVVDGNFIAFYMGGGLSLYRISMFEMFKESWTLTFFLPQSFRSVAVTSELGGQGGSKNSFS